MTFFEKRNGIRLEYRQQHGFTLIELMVVVVIIGILAAIAYPSYTRYMTQTRRSDAQIALTQMAGMQEKFFSDCNHYATILYGTTSPTNQRACGTSTASPPYSDGKLAYNNSTNTTVTSPDGHYVISLTTSTTSCPITSCYELIADPNATGASGRQAGNGKLKINSVGIKLWDKANNGTYSAKWTDK